MCWYEKCFYCIPVDLGCIIIGIITLLTSAITTLLSLTMLAIEHNSPEEGFYYIYEYVHLDLNPSSIHILLSFLVIFNVIWVLFSINLIFGVKKNKPSLVLAYFGFGVVITIVYSLAGLLLLLNGHWIMTLLLFVFILQYTHCLIVVYTAYEQLQSDKEFQPMINEDSDENLLIEPVA